MRVIVLEDEEMLLKAITTKLQRKDIEAQPFTSAGQALAYLNQTTILPDAIWLDYYLGDKNGSDFMRALSADSRFKEIPVLVVSNSASKEKMDEMMALGVKKYLIKAEYKLDEIIEIIKNLGEYVSE